MSDSPKEKLPKIKLVQGDTRPQLVFSLTDEVTHVPINISDAATVVQMRFRQVGSPTVKATLACSKLAGRVLKDGTIDYTAPYNVPGAGGRAFMDWGAGVLDTVGDFEGEIEITYGDGTVHTLFDMLKFKVRPQL